MKTVRFLLCMLFAASCFWGGCVDEDPTLWQPSAGPGEATSKKSAFQFGGGSVSQHTPGPPVPIDFDVTADTGF